MSSDLLGIDFDYTIVILKFRENNSQRIEQFTYQKLILK
jgi:hypothetical protein